MLRRSNTSLARSSSASTCESFKSLPTDSPPDLPPGRMSLTASDSRHTTGMANATIDDSHSTSPAPARCLHIPFVDQNGRTSPTMPSPARHATSLDLLRRTTATPFATTPTGILLDEAPTFISARAANSLLSENRPTRIQSEALHFLNRLLDEILLLILHSSRSLATNRIKTEGVLRVLNNNLLAKNAVLEAELELRTYLDGKRAEGAKVPLGLQATSRLDGTESFPVASAYNLLRNRCEVYSTLNDHEDDTAAGDQNIMSPEGRPVATITPGVAIYVTALLEFVGEYILQGMARVIERDNSDEASLTDFRAAMTEDEALSHLYGRLIVADEVKKRMDAAAARRTRRGANISSPNGGGDEFSRGVRPETRASRPWQVPNSEDMEEAVNMRSFGRRTSALLSGPGSSPRPGTATGVISDRGSSSVSGHGFSQDYKRESVQSVFNSAASTAAHGSVSVGGSTAVSHGASDSTATSGGFVRRLSNEGKAFGIFGGKRRGSLRQSQDVSQSGFFGKQTAQESKPKISLDSSMNPEDDFEALMMSGQTMKVSLTPNRLRTIEVPDKAAAAAAAATAAKLSQRTRPGTLNAERLRDADPVRPAGAATLSPSSPATMVRSSSTVSEEAGAPPRPASRAGTVTSITPARPSKVQSPPPSSYRGPGDSAAHDRTNGASTPLVSYRDDGFADEPASIDATLDQSKGRPFPSSGGDDDITAGGRSAHQPSASISSRHAPSPSLDFARRGMVGGVVRNLFGNKRASRDMSSSASPSLSARSYRGGPYSNGHASGENLASSVDLHSSQSVTQVQEPSNASATGSLGRNTSQPRQHAASFDLQDRDETRAAHQVRRKEVPGLGPAIVERPGTVMGVYGEPIARESSPPPSNQGRQEPPPSRKVPWSYTRRSSGNLGRRPSADERLARGSTTSVNEVYASSVDHAGASRGQYYAGSEGHVHNPARDTFASLPHSEKDVKTPTPAEILAGSSSAYAAGMVPLAMLLDLEQRMKGCSTVTEAQALLAAYIEDASAGRMSDLASRLGPSTSAELPQEATAGPTNAAVLANGNLTTDRSVVSKPIGGPILAMADEWVLEENTPLWNNHASIAGWLLDGESSPIVLHGPGSAAPASNSSGDAKGSGLTGHGSKPGLGHDVGRVVPGAERMRRPSAVSTANSTYRDAEE